MHSRAPNAPRNCASKSPRYYIFQGICAFKRLQSPPLLATLPDHWLHSCQSRWPKSCPERMLLCPSWNMRRNFHEISCGHFSWKLKDENERNLWPIFRRVLRPCQWQTLPEFSLSGIMFIKIVEKHKLLSLCVHRLCLVTWTHRHTHTHRDCVTERERESAKREKPVTVTNSEIPNRTN